MQRFSRIAGAAALSLGLGLGFVPASALAQSLWSEVDASTTWQNQDGSTMTISVDTNDNVAGTYINNAQGFGCQGTPYDLIGRVNGNFISFSVAWDNAYANCNSVTGWSGYAYQSGSDIMIATNWNLAYQSPSGPAIMAGSDTFTRVSKMNIASAVQ